MMSEMMTREKAYEILGLPQDAPEQDIKIKYENFMRRHRYDETIDVDLLTQAHDTLMGYDMHSKDKDPAYAQKGLNKKKVDNFFYHHKRNLLYGAVILIILVALSFSLFSGRRKVDFGVAFIGNLTMSDITRVEEYLQTVYEINNIGVTYASYALDQGEASAANIIRLMGVITDPMYNVLYMNKEAAEFLATEEGLVDLTPYFTEIGIVRQDERILWVTTDTGKVIAGAILVGRDLELQDLIIGFVPDYIGISKSDTDKTTSITLIRGLLERRL
ncbi:MAG: hypothetical protein R6W96_00800 [Clostridia bacterium]